MLTHRRDRQSGLLSSSAKSLSPILKAYILAYLTSTIPRLPAVIKTCLKARIPLRQRWDLIKTVLVGSIGSNRFPTACALIVNGATVLPRLLRNLLSRLQGSSSSPPFRALLSLLKARLALICTFASAWLAFDLLNRDEGWGRKRAKSRAAQQQTRPSFESPNQHHLPPPGCHTTYAGKTIDFTLLAVCRAIDMLIITTWVLTRGRKHHPERHVPRVSRLLQRLADPSLFAASAAVIMWSWFYSPERLPKQYNQWISKVADIDHRLIKALRLCRRGSLIYGSADTQDAELPSLCEELKLPKIWGNPAEIVPIPCELYHCGAGKSCEVHAARRFLKTFRLAIRLYLPLQLLSLFRKFSLHPKRIASLLKDAARSSTFLASFVGLFYYAVCLARTRIGPNVFARSMVTWQMWDSGLCVLAGCLACGWSIMFEKAGRRQEIAFFVAPRALATLMPRVYDKRYQRREQIAFATSVALVMNAAQSRNHHVRGVLGSILNNVLQ